MGTNAVTRVPEEWHARLVAYLDGRMTPERWLGLKIREWAGILATKKLPHAAIRKGNLVRIVAHVSYDLTLPWARHKSRSESEWLWWLCASAFDPTKPLPEDTMRQARMAKNTLPRRPFKIDLAHEIMKVVQLSGCGDLDSGEIKVQLVKLRREVLESLHDLLWKPKP